ncbi:MAG TPA: glycosyltransferase family 1 protein [Thermoleophilia bacterium]|nr:glycosyltransferase family 1 protein [Thermoleophilia bacterium]
MDFVTITDHNTLDGSLSIAHLPGTFLSSELDVVLADDDCRVHVVVLGVEERRFADLLALKTDARDLSAYLNAEAIVHFVSHPLYAVDGRLTPDIVEKLLLLFSGFEVRNGARSSRSNELVGQVLAGLTPRTMARLAEKHGLEPAGPWPHRKVAVGGSDDHSGMFAAGAWTEGLCDGSVEGFLDAVRRGDCGPGGDSGEAHYLAHSIYAVTRSCVVDLADPVRGRRLPGAERVLRRLCGVDLRGGDPREGSVNLVASVFRGRDAEPLRRRFAETYERELGSMVHAEIPATELNRRLYSVAKGFAEDAFRLSSERLLDGVFSRRPRRAAAGLAGVALTHLLATPYYVAHAHQTAERPLLADVRRQLLGPETSGGRDAWENPPAAGARRIALFTDTVHEVNGVALTIKRLIEVARRRGIHLQVFTSHAAPPAVDGVANLASCGGFAIPRYPDLSVNAPSFLDVLARLQDGGFTHVHVSTPGPVGLLGFAAAKVLHLPVAGTYHTDIPRYARDLGGTRLLEEVAWRYVLWFYRRLDEVLVPSAATGRELTSRGLPPWKVKPLPRWVDTTCFTPLKRDPLLFGHGPVGSCRTFLYAGRVSREKNLGLLVAAFKRLRSRGYAASLVIAGDGPYRAEMEVSLRGWPAEFLGFQDQETLATTYASCDVFVFPSATDTFGNVVLEAQASGLPVIVSDRGGPQELMSPGRTGFAVPAGDVTAFAAAMACFASDPGLAKRMGANARAFCLEGAPPPDALYSTLLGPGEDERADRVA